MLLFFGTKVSLTAPRTKSNAYSKAFCILLGFFTEAFLVIDQKKKLTRQPRKIETAMGSGIKTTVEEELSIAKNLRQHLN